MSAKRDRNRHYGVRVTVESGHRRVCARLPPTARIKNERFFEKALELDDLFAVPTSLS